MTDLLQQSAKLAEHDPDIAVVWLYGSHAKGNAHAASDYDLAVAINRFIEDDLIEKRLRPECLALDWQQALGLQIFSCPSWTLIRRRFRWRLKSFGRIRSFFAGMRTGFGGKLSVFIAAWNWIMPHQHPLDFILKVKQQCKFPR
jgi:hypothetical protein